MTRPRIWDSFMFNSELDMLECRLRELEGIPNLSHVIVEAPVDHQDHPKPLYFAENRERFDQWKDRIVHVVAGPLPSAEDASDPWAREHAQREFVADGLRDAADSDVVLHGDCDEIPTALAARNVRPRGMVAFDMACYSMAVDWQHPQRWRGTVAALAGNIRSFSQMRDARNFAPHLPNAGWHLGWLGDRQARLDKLGAFCHPEIAERTLSGLENDWFLRAGVHVDGAKLLPVDVDGSWPRWVASRECPPDWFRPRASFMEDWFGEPSCRVLASLARSVRGVEGAIVEVGCWEGRSTIALANACHPVFVEAVDTWEGSPGEISAELAQERDVFATFQANVKAMTAGNVTAHRMGWREYFATRRGPVRLCHIDATHTFEEVRDNIDAVLPLLASGGVLCGDDFHHPPVRRAVLERLPDVEQAATLWIWRNP